MQIHYALASSFFSRPYRINNLPKENKKVERLTFELHLCICNYLYSMSLSHSSPQTVGIPGPCNDALNDCSNW